MICVLSNVEKLLVKCWFFKLSYSKRLERWGNGVGLLGALSCRSFSTEFLETDWSLAGSQQHN